MENILVTGGCGFIGSNFIRFLLGRADFAGRIVNVDNLTYAGNPENLAGVSAIDSSGIGEMVACYTTVTKRGGQLKLLRLSPKINDILQVTQLITVFDVFETESEAIASLS